MFAFVRFAFVGCLALVGCGGSSNGNGSEGGSPGQCDETATQLCQKAASCSTDHDGGVSVFITSAVDGGLNSSVFTVNGDESHCESFLHLTCLGDQAAKFTAACGPVLSGLQCGTDSTFGNGVELPAACGQNL